jgi:hypothetical protein
LHYAAAVFLTGIKNVKDRLLLEVHFGIPETFTVKQAHAQATKTS